MFLNSLPNCDVFIYHNSQVISYMKSIANPLSDKNTNSRLRSVFTIQMCHCLYVTLMTMIIAIYRLYLITIIERKTSSFNTYREKKSCQAGWQLSQLEKILAHVAHSY